MNRIEQLQKDIRPTALKCLKAWSKWQLQWRGIARLLKNRPSSAYAPYWEDLWFLYRLVRKLKPRCVLEFGAGCSTVVLAKAIYDNRNGGHLYSVDASEYWAKTTWKLMPERLKSITTCSHSEMVAANFGGIMAMRHAQRPDVSPDFIFLDGPDFQDFKQLGAISAACDPVDLEPRFTPGFCMVVDGRTENTKFLREHLKKDYVVSHHWPQNWWETTVFRLV